MEIGVLTGADRSGPIPDNEPVKGRICGSQSSDSYVLAGADWFTRLRRSHGCPSPAVICYGGWIKP